MGARAFAIITLICLLPFSAVARDLKVVTWNLRWHLDRALAAEWIAACSQKFALDPQTNLMTPTDDPNGTPGWKVDVYKKAVWDRVKFPPCNVYRLPVTMGAWDKRNTQLTSFIQQTLPADIYAFQEVSGEQAVRDILPNNGADYELCSFTDFKVQRIAIVWRKTLGPKVQCQPDKPMTLPTNTIDKQVRPGLAASLTVDGQKLRILAVHLKSGCVSPQQDSGDLTGGGDNCPLLQQQAVPFEAWVEREVDTADKVVLLGDFNRNFWHEAIFTEPVRTDASEPTSALPQGVLVRNLYREVFDGLPDKSRFELLQEACPLNQAAEELCAKAKTEDLKDEDLDKLRAPESLGCRNPIGLDHVMAGPGVTSSKPADKVAMGKFGRTLPPTTGNPDPLLALSDHCPLVATVSF